MAKSGQLFSQEITDVFIVNPACFRNSIRICINDGDTPLGKKVFVQGAFGVYRFPDDAVRFVADQ